MTPMKSLFISLFFVLSLPVLNAQQTSGVIEVDPGEFQKLISKGSGTLLDVRTNSEFTAEHIENAAQLNFYSPGFKKKLELLPKGQPILLYCNTGYRSKKAAEYLVKKGYTDVYNLEHGIMDWNLNELPVVEGDKSKLNKENTMSENEYAKLIESEPLVFIDFYAPWCGPCRKMMPMIDSLKTAYHGRVKISKVNSDASKKLIKKMQLNGVPYLVLYKNNEVVYTHSGLVSREELIELFDENLAQNSH